MKIGDKIKLDDYGVIRTYTITKPGMRHPSERLQEGDVYLTSPGVVGFDASIDWVNQNMIHDKMESRRNMKNTHMMEDGGVIGQEIVFDDSGEENIGVIKDIHETTGDYIVATDDGRTVLAQKDMDVISLGKMRTKSAEAKRRFSFFEDGGGVHGDAYRTVFTDEDGTDYRYFKDKQEALRDYDDVAGLDAKVAIQELIRGEYVTIEDNSEARKLTNPEYIELSDGQTTLSVEKYDGKWYEGDVITGEEPYGWGGKTYMGYLKPEQIASYLSMDYNSSYKVIDVYQDGGKMVRGGKTDSTEIFDLEYGDVFQVTNPNHGFNGQYFVYVDLNDSDEAIYIEALLFPGLENQSVLMLDARLKNRGYYINIKDIQDGDIRILTKAEAGEMLMKYYIRKNKFEDGGNIAKENNEMLHSQAKESKHHIEELHDILTSKTKVEPWVVAKMTRAKTDLSDITHYLEGMPNKMAKGGKLTDSQQNKFDKVMREWKEGKLHSGSANGPIVKSQDQAIAIAYSEAYGMDKMLFGGMVNDLSDDAIDRMEGLVPISTLQELLDNAKYIIVDMENEGFEKDEVMSFLAYKISQIGGGNMMQSVSQVQPWTMEDENALRGWIMDIQDGFGWITPGYVESSWTTRPGSGTKEWNGDIQQRVYQRLIDENMLFAENPNDSMKKGKKIKGVTTAIWTAAEENGYKHGGKMAKGGAVDDIEPMGYKRKDAVEYGKKLVDKGFKHIEIRNNLELHYPGLKSEMQGVINDILDYKESKMQTGGGVVQSKEEKMIASKAKAIFRNLKKDGYDNFDLAMMTKEEANETVQDFSDIPDNLKKEVAHYLYTLCQNVRFENGGKMQTGGRMQISDKLEKYNIKNKTKYRIYDGDNLEMIGTVLILFDSYIKIKDSKGLVYSLSLLEYKYKNLKFEEFENGGKMQTGGGVVQSKEEKMIASKAKAIFRNLKKDGYDNFDLAMMTKEEANETVQDFSDIPDNLKKEVAHYLYTLCQNVRFENGGKMSGWKHKSK